MITSESTTNLLRAAKSDTLVFDVFRDMVFRAWIEEKNAKKASDDFSSTGETKLYCEGFSAGRGA